MEVTPITTIVTATIIIAVLLILLMVALLLLVYLFVWVLSENMSSLVFGRDCSVVVVRWWSDYPARLVL